MQNVSNLRNSENFIYEFDLKGSLDGRKSPYDVKSKNKK